MPEQPDFTTIDVSFISLKLVMPCVDRLLKPGTIIVALIKPQFEDNRRAVKKGIMRDNVVHTTICSDIARFMRSLDWQVGSIIASPITDGDGNQEFFIEARRG